MAHDARPDGETDMTADGIAPDDVPTHDPANTEVGAENHDENRENEEDA